MAADSYLRGEDLSTRFAQLGQFLKAHRALWHPRPFVHDAVPWEASHPALANWLRGRTLSEAEFAHHEPHRLDAPAPFHDIARCAWTLSQLGPLPRRHIAPPPHRLNVDVPGRKWQQVEAFADHLEPSEPNAHWLDWCAGKGHLGRRLVQPGQRLTALEFDLALVKAGERLSAQHRIPAVHRLQDVLTPDTAELLEPEHSAVALHACGDLHVRLMELASDAGCRQIAIAPCCYNRIKDSCYRPLSEPARRQGLELDLHDLALPASETVTAGARVRRQRDQSMAWRLGFDLLQRSLRDSPAYLPTPSLSSTWLNQPFEHYIRHLLSLKKLSLSVAPDWAELERAGWARLAQVRNLELVRLLFRRPLELWLALDRALYLREKGYEVKLGTFCESNLTPRNMLILAQR